MDVEIQLEVMKLPSAASKVGEDRLEQALNS